MKTKKIYIETLGCNKNIVDSEIITTLLKENSFEFTSDPKKAKYIIVNTCGFIDEAKEESINTILSLAQYKKSDNHIKLYVTGCFSQLYHDEILKKMPEIDAVFGIGNFNSLINAIRNNDTARFYNESFTIDPDYIEYNIKSRYLSTTGFAYLKIAEGCNRRCSFCLIPKIKGPFRSRKIDSIIQEIKELERKDIYEVILVSQDTLSYGTDIEVKGGLRDLLEEILKRTSVGWIRLLYLRPSRYILNLLDLFNNERLIPYFDIPIQHSSNKILKLMKREGRGEEYLEIIDKIREKIPKSVIRTSVIVGFPGEEKIDFKILKELVQKAKFNHVGIFTYSPQETTEAYSLKGKINKEIAKRRREELYNIQGGISRKLLSKEIGKKFQVLIEEKVEGDNIYFGRSYHFAPEVDGVFVVYSGEKLKVPTIVNCIVKRAETYDLHGTMV